MHNNGHNGLVLVTKNAQTALLQDGLDYTELYTELKGELPLRIFVEKIGSPPSIAYWNKFERGEIRELNHIARNRLRKAAGLPELPVPITILTELLDPDASIWRIEGSKTGVLIFDRVNIPEPHLNAFVGLCNQVTKATRKRGIEDYRDLFDVPVKVLAWAIREREEVK
jgi:hypothetical protein